MKEVFKGITSYELYEVSNLGRIKSKAQEKRKWEIFLKPMDLRFDYQAVDLGKNGGVKRF